MITNTIIGLYLVVLFLALIHLIIKLTPLLEQNQRKKKVVLFVTELLCSSFFYFGVLGQAESISTPLFIGFALVFLGVVYYRSTRLIRSLDL